VPGFASPGQMSRLRMRGTAELRHRRFEKLEAGHLSCPTAAPPEVATFRTTSSAHQGVDFAREAINESARGTARNGAVRARNRGRLLAAEAREARPAPISSGSKHVESPSTLHGQCRVWSTMAVRSSVAGGGGTLKGGGALWRGGARSSSGLATTGVDDDRGDIYTEGRRLRGSAFKAYLRSARRGRGVPSVATSR